MSDQTMYDVVVVGAGIIGSATAYYLAKHGHRTLLLEQFMLPHTRGSSHGATRIIRKAYEQQYYAAMMGEAYEMWFQLEREAHAEIFKQTGVMVIGQKGAKTMSSMEKSLQAINSPYDVVSHAEMRRRYPQFKFDESHVAIFDPTAGFLKAQRALMAFQEMFRKFGGTMLDETKVTGVSPGSQVTVNTTRGQFKCKSVVFAVGPWAKEITESMGLNLPLQAQRLRVYYWKKGVPGGRPLDVPVFMIDLETPRHIRTCYLDTGEYENCVKICSHRGPAIDPRYRDAIQDTSDIDVLSEFVEEHFPGIESKPAIVEPCTYTMTPDDDFILDMHPRYKNIVIGAGFSGHGFKLAPVVGKILAEMALGQKTSYPTTPFRIDRFTQTTGPKYRDAIQDTSDIDVLSEFVKEHFPGIETKPAIVEPCTYTMTPDDDFILDMHPRYKNIVIGAGFSGHGFKLAPVVGKILAEMALGQKTSYPTTPFRIDRFTQTTGPKSHL